MDTAAMISRVNQLWDFQSDELTKKIQQTRQNIFRDYAGRGMLGSGNLIASLASAELDNFNEAVGEAWETPKQMHQAMGGDTEAMCKNAK
jgi:hypothetical protein